MTRNSFAHRSQPNKSLLEGEDVNAVLRFSATIGSLEQERLQRKRRTHW